MITNVMVLGSLYKKGYTGLCDYLGMLCGVI